MNSDRRSTWKTATAWRTYVAGALWFVGAGLALVSGEPDASGWFRVRLDAPGVVLLSGALIGGWNFFPKAVTAVRRLRLDMNFLMTVAIIGALLIGESNEAAAIAALFSLAELLEAAAVARARRSIEELVRLAPERARLVSDAGEREVPAADLRRGQRVRVRPGEKVPIDGRVVDGESAVNEATVTGESVPVTKREREPVYAGTVLVDGYLEIEATTDAGDTTLDRIVDLVRQAEARRSPSERFVQRFARYYTPAVTGLALLTMTAPPWLGLGTGLDWFTRGLTLLVVACPCAMVIATPVTVVSAITSAARHGVLIKGGEYLEALGRSCAMAFDKTGSLTEGTLEVSAVEGLSGTAPDDVVRLAAAVELRSEHPIAKAIVSYAQRDGVGSFAGDVTEFEAQTGRGAVARVDGRELRVGTPDLFPGASLPERFRELEEQGNTVVLVGDGERLLGLIALADRPRAAAARVLRRLERLGVHEQVMLTGDHELVAESIARELGIADVRARLQPADKVKAVEQLRSSHEAVAMLGDGVNDAPALAAATVGIAMGAAGAPATIETADVALMADDLTMLPYAVQLAKRARHVIVFSIAVAVGLKLLLAAGAIAGVVSLLVAVLVGDMGASLVVTLNAMRLARLSPEQVW